MTRANRGALANQKARSRLAELCSVCCIYYIQGRERKVDAMGVSADQIMGGGPGEPRECEEIFLVARKRNRVTALRVPRGLILTDRPPWLSCSGTSG